MKTKRKQGGESTSNLVCSALAGNNAELFAKIASLYFKKGDRIADTTFGKGVFWRDIDTTAFEFFRPTSRLAWTQEAYHTKPRVSMFACSTLRTWRDFLGIRWSRWLETETSLRSGNAIPMPNRITTAIANTMTECLTFTCNRPLKPCGY